MAKVEDQVAYILEVMVSSAVSEVSKVFYGNKEDSEATAETESLDQKMFQLSLFMEALAQDAVEKLCQVFHESKVTETEELRRKLEATESDLQLALENRENQENQERPLTPRPAALQNGQIPGEKRRNVVVICDTALKRMPFFRYWTKTRKSRVRKATVQDKHVHQQEQEEGGPNRNTETEEGPDTNMETEEGPDRNTETEEGPDRSTATEEGPDWNTETEEGPREPSSEQQTEVNQDQDDLQTHEPIEDIVDVVVIDGPEDDGVELGPEEVTGIRESEPAMQSEDARLDLINKQKDYLCKLVKKVRTVSEKKTVKKKAKCSKPAPPEPVTCSICDKVYPKQKLLDTHMLAHTGEKPHLCDVCGKSFRIRGSLLIHQRKHSDKRYFTCETCGKSFIRKSSLDQHKLVHTQEKPHVCQYCGKAFSMSANLKRHIRLHTGEKPHTCNYCGKSFIQNASLQAHIIKHTGVKPHRCYCGKAYTQKYALNQHQMTHDSEQAWDSPVACIACETTHPRRSMAAHLQTHTTPLSCIRCSLPLMTPAELRFHQREHTGKKPHACHICHKSFQSQNYLKIHIHNHSKDSESKPFHCTICGRNFAHQTSLTYHKAVHSGEKPYACQTCGKTFSNPGNVSRHQLVHTGLKPYTCKICNRGFNQSCSLKAHVRTHTGDKPYSCNNCGRSFSDKRNLKEHKCRA